jgi:hypothetical protein
MKAFCRLRLRDAIAYRSFRRERAHFVTTIRHGRDDYVPLHFTGSLVITPAKRTCNRSAAVYHLSREMPEISFDAYNLMI